MFESSCDPTRNFNTSSNVRMHAPIEFPALLLFPQDESFLPRQINLLNGERAIIGRQIDCATEPTADNGFFDADVVSKDHAEVWEEQGKIFLKDTKSDNGTYLNGERLSPTGEESDAYELKSNDIVVRV